MLSSQIIKNCIGELYSITKVEMSIYDAEGIAAFETSDKCMTDTEVLSGFIASPADSQVIGEQHYLKVYDNEELVYTVTAYGSDDNAYAAGRIAVSELKQLISAYRERFDGSNFFQNLIMDNLLLVDVYSRAKKLRIDPFVPRIVYVVEADKGSGGEIKEALKNMFSSRSGDYVTAVYESNVILIKQLEKGYSEEELEHTAQSIVDTLSAELMINVRVGYGSVVGDLKDVSKSYKEAMLATDVGKIFNIEKRVNSYASLGIGRLIYQLPVNLCRMFIDEVFKNCDPKAFDDEIVATVYKFFENSLNVSETARQLFIHRNTLVYRIEKLKSLTGLDVRIFDDALTFVIAMMVYDYLRYMENSEN